MLSVGQLLMHSARFVLTHIQGTAEKSYQVTLLCSGVWAETWQASISKPG